LGLVPHRRRWPASLAVALVLLAQVLIIPPRVSVGQVWMLPGLQALLLAPLVVTNPISLVKQHPVLRWLAAISAVTVALANAVTLLHLIVLLGNGVPLDPTVLIQTGVVLLATNVVAVAVLLWELDRGGPFARDPKHPQHPLPPDLLFAQMSMEDTDARGWRPGFLDYLFVAFTISTAFSPTDTMPLTGRAKAIFMAGAIVAVATIAIVAARAVNLL
jgi:hypothetical protein